MEQLLGRILRLPRASSKQQEQLNRAYAMISSQRFVDTLNHLGEALIENGFEAIEASRFVTYEQPALTHLGPLFGASQVCEKVPERPDLTKLDQALRERVIFDGELGTLTVSGHLVPSDRTALERCFVTSEGKMAVQRIYDSSRGIAAADRIPAPMKVPALCIRVNGELEFFEESHFLEGPWDLAACDATLREGEFPSEVSAGAEGEVDVSAAGKVETRFVKEVRTQLALLRVEGTWTLPGLANWLDRKIPHPDITRTQSTLFIQKAIERLIETRGVEVAQLAAEKYRLCGAIGDLIERHRRQRRKEGYQALLFGSRGEEIETSPEIPFIIGEESYAPNWYYEGTYQFQKHALPIVGELKSDGEEFDCARYIDLSPDVARWVRNLERRPESSFWLQTATDRFYPDFIAELRDGRFLVIEYKGEHLWSNADSGEKRAVGKLWADRSRGACLFVMPKGPQWSAIDDVINGRV